MGEDGDRSRHLSPAARGHDGRGDGGVLPARVRAQGRPTRSRPSTSATPTSSTLAQARALAADGAPAELHALRLRGLHRRRHQAPERGAREHRGGARRRRRRRRRALPRGAAAPGQRARPRPPAAALRRPLPRHRRAAESPARAHRRPQRRARPRPRRRVGARALRAASASRRGRCTQPRARSWPTTGDLYRRSAGRRSCAAAWASRSPTRLRPTSPGCGARRSSTPPSRRTGAPGAAGDAARPRHRPRRAAATSSSTSTPGPARCRGPSARRSASPAA